MLINSTLTNLVSNNLHEVLDSATAPMQKRVEAAWVMWLRTKNIQYLDRLYSLVKVKGNIGVFHGRHYLKISIKEGTELYKWVDKPETEDLPLSIEDFKTHLSKPGMIVEM